MLPAAEEIEAKHFDVTRDLLKKAGDLGLMAVDIPEEYGGLAMDKVTSAIVADHLSQLGSFSVAFSAHVGIGTLPIVWYGTDAQKQKFLPRLATGDCIGAYALSEASSGSDAMNIRARATLSADGTHYLLNGEKMWISNAGFADLFTVFAKIDGEKFSAFLIETRHARPHDWRGRAQARHPRLLHLPADSLRLQDAGREPAWRSGQGPPHRLQHSQHRPFQAGRGLRGRRAHGLGNAIRYAKQRKAFGKPIAGFGLIQEKLADSAAQLFAGESMAYRTVGMIDARCPLSKAAPRRMRVRFRSASRSTPSSAPF